MPTVSDTNPEPAPEDIPRPEEPPSQQGLQPPSESHKIPYIGHTSFAAVRTDSYGFDLAPGQDDSDPDSDE